MNRRTLVFSAATIPATIFIPAGAQSQGIKIRFVITRMATLSYGSVDTETYENAVLLAPRKRLEADLAGYRIGVRALPVGKGVRVEFAPRDLGRSMAKSVAGEVTVKMGQGGGIDFPVQETGFYAVGLLVTQQALPGKAAA